MSRRRGRARIAPPTLLGAALAALLALGAGLPGAAAGAPAARALQVAPRIPAGAHAVGPLPAAATLHLTIALRPRDAQALAQFAASVSEPASPLYRHFLSVAQFAARFGAAPSAIATVQRALRAAGLTPGPLAANGLSIPLLAPAGAVERAFSTDLEQVRLPGGRVAYANTRAPSLASAAAGEVQAVIGLSTLYRPHALDSAARGSSPRFASPALSPRGAPAACAAASADAASSDGYTASQIAQAFGISGLWGRGDFGQGEHIAVYELEGNFPADITAFQSCYGTSAAVSYSTPTREGAPPPPNAANYDGIETELDVENAIALAPAATIDVYQAPDGVGASDYDLYSSIVTRNADPIITTSWGLCESELGRSAANAENTLFQEAAGQGQEIFAAAGDDGSEDCYSSSGGYDASLQVDDPASQPFVTGVGGTSLASVSPVAQSVWNDGTPTSSGGGAGGGGISSLWQMPSYQSSAPASLHVVNSKSSRTPCSAPSGAWCREIPDVSFSADSNHPYAIYWDGQWTGVGGTSGAAPVWAAYLALSADQGLAGCTSGERLGFANPLLYGLAAGGYGSLFDDVTSGNNDELAANGGLYPAGSGYDMASGLGTFSSAALASALCDHVTITAPSSLRVTDGTKLAPVRLSAQSSSGQAILAWSASGLPSGLTLSASGILSGTPGSGQTGVHEVTVTAADASGAAGAVQLAIDVLPSTIQLGLHAHWPTLAWPVGFAIGSHQLAQASDSSVPGASGFRYAASGLPPGLRLSSAGVLSGTPKRAGRYPVKVTAGDGYGSGSVTSTWTVYGDPRALAPSLTGRGLSFRLQAGSEEPGLVRGFTLKLPPAIRLRGSRGVRLSARARRIAVSAHGDTLSVALRAGASRLSVSVPASDLRIASRRPRSTRLSVFVADAANAVPLRIRLRIG
jgi:hypothetical protein